MCPTRRPLTTSYLKELLLQERHGCRSPFLVPVLLRLEYHLVSVTKGDSLAVANLRYWASSVFEYTYLLFWNIFWTLLPVIALGLFDRDIGKSQDSVCVKGDNSSWYF
jgi:hypothetical protein